ncbi:protein virilizer homolog isoform X6 [Montipora capricornis]|uniref:protein virilizer homolog isoform X6 n=2 Tax=Montipora capricornis TaxID=246305 RepID=UPI0035F1D094
MAAVVSPEIVDPVLLFCDTFSHPENEEMHLDLVSFPRPVCVQEVRVIPAGHRVHAAVSEREKMGETHPPSFKLDLFIRNLDRPSDVVFERLGQLEYKEPNNFQLVTYSKGATDVVVLRGWYNRITISLYGLFTDVNQRAHELRPETRAERPPVIVEKRGPERDSERMDQESGKVAPETVPVRAERTFEQGPEKPKRDRSADRITELGPNKSSLERSSEVRDKHEGQPQPREEKKGAKEKERIPPKSPPSIKSPSRSPSIVTATVGDSTAAKPTTPPGSPREEQAADEEESGNQSADDLFEPLTPDRSPSNLFMSDDEEPEDVDGYEEILSDEEDMEDGTLDDTDVTFGELDVYSEDAWMSVSVSFNPYQCDLSILTAFTPPDSTEHEKAVLKASEDSYSADEQQVNLGQALFEQVELCCTSERNLKWIELLEEIPKLLVPGLAYLSRSEQKEGIMRKLVEWIMYSLDIEMAQQLPIAANIRLIKAGLKLVGAMCSCGTEISSVLIKAGVQEALGKLLITEHMSSSMKLLTLQAIDNTTDCYVGMEHFLQWETDDKERKGEGNDRKQESRSYQQLVDFLLADQTVRVVEAASALAHKVHLYELLALLQKSVDKIVESSPTSLPQEGETDSAGETTEIKESADIMSPNHNSTVDVSGEREQLDAEGIEIISSILEEICTFLKQAKNLIMQAPVKAFPTSAKITGFINDPKDPYPVIFHFFRARRLLESILIIMSSSVGGHPAVFSPVRDLFLLLLQSQKGLLFLSSHPDTVNGLIRVVTQSTEADIHHSEAPPLNEILRDSTVADACTPQHLGLLLIYHLQTLQAVDQLLTSLSPGLLTNDMDGADILSTLHTLYSMTFTAIGKAAVVSVLSLDTNLRSLLPFVESTGNAEDDAKLKKCVSTRYATVLILLTVKLSENVEMFSKLGPRLLAITERVDADTSLTELSHWLVALKDITFDMTSIGKLVEFVKSHVDEVNTTPSAGCGVLMALRILRHLGCLADDSSSDEVIQKDLNQNLACIELFSANAMDVFITTLQKLGEFLLRPWRQGQPLHIGPPLVMVSMITPLLALVTTMLEQLLNNGKYQFKDTRLMKSLMVLHTVMCSAPMTGQLSSLAHQIQSEIVSVFMTFTRPVVQSADHEEAINESIWSLMLKELLEYTTSAPQAFLGGLVLLSELLPIPLPIRSLEDMPQEEANQVMNHRRMWSAHLNPLSTELQGILKDLAGSACHSLQQVMRRVCSQLSDLSAPTAFNIVRTLLETLDSEMGKSEGEENSCTTGGVRIMTLLAYLSSQPAVKVSLLQLLKTSGNAKNDDLLFPNLLPSMLSCIKGDSENQTVSRSQYCVVSIVQSLCDPTVSLIPFQTPFTDQHLANTLPDKEMLEVICAALLEHIGSEKQSFATILLALRTLLTLTEHNYGVYHQKTALENNSEVFYRLLKRLSTSFENSIPGPDHLSTLSTTIELLQLLLPEADTAEVLPAEQDDEVLEGESLKRTTEISISATQLRNFLKFDTSAEDGPLKTLEKRLEESCKEDEALEPLLDAVRVLTAMLGKTEGENDKEPEDVTEPQLPSPLPLQTLFVDRLVFIEGEVEDGSVSPTLWYSTPPPDDIDPEVDLIKSSVDSLREKFCPDFDLKAELEKGLVPSPPGSPTRKKGHRTKRKFDPLISGQRKDNKKMKTAPSVPMRGGGRGMRGMGRGRGNPRMNDVFRSRKQNTSRPPSMHVDDFMAMEIAGTQDSQPMRRPGPKGPPSGRSMDHGPAGFLGNQGRWAGIPGGPLRKGPGMENQGAMRGTGPDWSNPRQHPMGAFPGQRNFQRGPDWGSQAPQPYRGGGGGALRENYSRPQPMRGFWDAPKSKDDSRFMLPPNVGGYRPGTGRGYPGRHMRSFTR